MPKLLVLILGLWLSAATAAATAAALAPHDPELQLLEVTNAIERRPQDGRLYLRRANCYLQLREPANALRDFEVASVLLPNDSAPQIGRAMILWQQGRDVEAMMAIDRALVLGAELRGVEGADLLWTRAKDPRSVDDQSLLW